jgi:hypothetical protein
MKTKQIMVLMLLGVFAGFASASDTGQYNVTLTIGTSAPTIVSVNAIPAGTPQAGTTTQILCNFTAQDLNGVVNFDTTGSNTECSVNNGGGTYRDSGSGACTQHNIDAIQAYFECPISMNFYDPTGIYTVTAYVSDLVANHASDSTTNFTYNTLTAISLDKAAMSFSALAVGTTIASTDNPVNIQNIGNQFINTTAVKSYDLHNGAYNLAAENFNATKTAGAPGVGTGAPMVNATYVTVPELTIGTGASVTGPINLWVNVPIGTQSGAYHSMLPWVVQCSI